MRYLQISLRTIFVIVFLLNLLNLAPLQTAHASSLMVCASGCTFTTVGAAVSAATANDSITVKAGTYHESNIDFSKNLTIKGVGSAQVIMDAQNNGRIFSIDAGKTVHIEGMTLQNGNISTTDNDGGAIFNQGTLTLDDVKLLNNHADDMGGAIFSEGNLSISNSTFSGNNNNTARATGASGGAIAAASTGSSSLENVQLTNNTAKYGGAIAILAYGHTAGKTFTLNNTTLSNNTATQQGGALFVEQIDTTITNSLINDNGATSSFAGGMYFSGANSSLTIKNVTISHNHGLNGGGLYFSPALAVTLNGVTVTLNNSTDAVNNGGGGIYAAPAIPLTIRNSIVAGNTDTVGGTAHPDCYFSATSITYSLIGNTTGCTATTFSNNATGISPQLDPLANYGGQTFTHRLKSTSPAIDSADNATCPADDQRGVLRPKDGDGNRIAVCDMGAYEVRLNQTNTFSSIAAQDGWLLESSENSNVGGTANASATTIRLGDDASKKQYRSILSFNTSSLPDTAIITAVTLKLKKQAVVGGGDPVAIFQGFLVDIKTGVFGPFAALQVADFQITDGKVLGPASPALVGGIYSINLTNGKADINELASNSGLTQIHLHFKLDDNNDAVANYLSLFSGDATTASNRPQLVVTYYMP